MRIETISPDLISRGWFQNIRLVPLEHTETPDLGNKNLVDSKDKICAGESKYTFGALVSELRPRPSKI